MTISEVTSDAFAHFSLGSYSRRAPPRVVDLFQGPLRQFSPYEYLYYILSEHLDHGKVKRSLLHRTNLLVSDRSVTEFLEWKKVSQEETGVECRVYAEQIRTYTPLWGGVQEYLDSEDGKRIPILVRTDALMEQGQKASEAIDSSRKTTFWLTLYGAPEYLHSCTLLRIWVQKQLWAGDGPVIPDYFGSRTYESLLQRRRADAG